MRSTSSHGKLTPQEIVILPAMAALIFASKLAMAALPNIHLVAVLLILCTISFGWKSLYTTFIYVLLEGLVYGFGLWWIAYLYIWPLLVVLTMLIRPLHSYLLYAVLACAFGLLFGALCSIVYLFVLGFYGAISWWLAGVVFDLVHGVSNLVLTLVLLPPLDKLMQRLMRRLKRA